MDAPRCSLSSGLRHGPPPSLGCRRIWAVCSASPQGLQDRPNGSPKSLGTGPDIIIGHIRSFRHASDGSKASYEATRGSRERPRAPLIRGPDPLTLHLLLGIEDSEGPGDVTRSVRGTVADQAAVHQEQDPWLGRRPLGHLMGCRLPARNPSDISFCRICGDTRDLGSLGGSSAGARIAQAFGIGPTTLGRLWPHEFAILDATSVGGSDRPLVTPGAPGRGSGSSRAFSVLWASCRSLLGPTCLGQRRSAHAAPVAFSIPLAPAISCTLIFHIAPYLPPGPFGSHGPK